MNAALYDAAKFMLRTLFKIVWRMREFGTENVPATGPVIVACNHVSYLDPPVLGTACPRRLQYMAKQELFKIPVLGPVIAAIGAYPVDRKGSASAAIKRSLEVLKAGGAIGIFPEGTRIRSGEGEPHIGVALLASLGKARVVPAYVSGTLHPGRFPRFEVRFGAPMRLPETKANRDNLQEFAREVMRAVHALGAPV